MRIVILTQSAPAYLAPFLDDVLAELEGHEVVAMVVLPPFFKRSRWTEIRERLDFYGVYGFLRMGLYIVQNKLLSYFNPRHSTKGVLKKYGIPRWEVANVNSPEFISRLQAEKIDLLISIAFPKILKQPLLETPPHGCINYHTALLPKYRGRQPLFWAMYHDEAEVGMTVHEMDAGIDSGAIISQARLPISPRDSLHDLYLKTTERGAKLLLEAIHKLAAGDTARLVNDPEKASYFTFPTPQESRQFRQKGKRFF